MLDENEIKKFFKQDKLAKYLGIELVDVLDDGVIAKLDIQDEHLNSIGTVHGGTIFTLADFTFAVAASIQGKISVAFNVNISFMKAATNGTLTARAKKISLNPKIGSYTVNVYDNKGDIIAIFQGMAYIKK
ncbi:MAG: PaaI family thioesterase [Methanobacterium sp.]|nr:PaaI family thioesterase [Methanobacterium sp.]